MVEISYDCPICSKPFEGSQETCPQMPYNNSHSPLVAGEYVCNDCYEEHSR